MNLTERDKEVMKLLAEGRSNGYIAEKLYRTKAAIRDRLKKLYVKLNINSDKFDRRLKLALLGKELKDRKE